MERLECEAQQSMISWQVFRCEELDTQGKIIKLRDSLQWEVIDEIKKLEKIKEASSEVYL